VLDTTAIPSDLQRRHRLSTTRRRATSLLVFSTAVFVAATIAGPGALAGYIQATAEASMIGALADWFAVVALFRHPLGIPIPHTAVVVSRKDQFGIVLGEFVQHGLLTPAAIAERLHAVSPARTVATWLTDPAHADRVAGHLIEAAALVVESIDDHDLHDAMDELVRHQLERIEPAPLAGRSLQVVMSSERGRTVIFGSMRTLADYVDVHRTEVRYSLEETAPWWLSGSLGGRILDRLIDTFAQALRDIADDPHSSLRTSIDEAMHRLAHHLQTSPEARVRGDELLRELLAHPDTRQFIASIADDIRDSLRSQASGDDTALQDRLAVAIASASRRIGADDEMLDRADRAVETAVTAVVERFHDEIAALVAGTVERWDAREAAQRLELLLGPDLQYIRISGALVGATAGLFLHAVTDLMT
jgi:uncharacterized membrane-anchored protein YjiN (DUF445 family)